MNRYGSRIFSCANAILAIGGLSTTLSVDAAVLCAPDASTRESLLLSKMDDHRNKMADAARLCMTDATGSPWTASRGAATPVQLHIAGVVRRGSLDDRDDTDPDRRIMRFSGRTETPARRGTEDDFIGDHKRGGDLQDVHLADWSKWRGRSSDSNEHVRDWEDRLHRGEGRHHPDWERCDEPVTAVPLPAAAALFAPGLALLGFVRRRKTQTRAA